MALFGRVHPISISNSTGNRNASLDVWRGVAILLVLAAHFGGLGFLSNIGFRGVDLFFVLSGLLISGLLFAEYKKTGNLDLRRFWMRRGFKIYPPFYIFMAFTTAGCAASGRIPRRILSDLFFMQDYFTPVAQHGWTLAIEEQFYFLLPILLIILARTTGTRSAPFRAVPIAFLALSLLCLAGRILNAGPRWAFHLRADELFTGVVLSYCYHFRKDVFERCSRWLCFPLGLILCAMAVPWQFGNDVTLWDVTIGVSFFSIGLSFLLAFSVGRRLPDPFDLLKFAGRSSYSVYLWHLVVLDNWPRSLRTAHFFLLYAAVALALGWLATVMVERPFLTLRDRYFSKQEAGKDFSCIMPGQSDRPPVDQPTLLMCNPTGVTAASAVSALVSGSVGQNAS